mmetsp:Transcript_29276/g.49358  ORF Transcript_29276/g.49358 Transcript_29276/m.49358 type:complete len:278 (-) Transcript_29276:328-1161(-)
MTNVAFPIAILLLATSNANGHGARNGWIKPPTPDNVSASDYQYEIDGTMYTGYVAFPSNFDPVTSIKGTLLAHQWYGLGDMEKYRCEEVASTLGYLCFALDVYGTGVRATDDAEAGLLMDALLADPAELHARIQGSLNTMLALPTAAPFPSLNTSAVSANGYCFGGLMVLELARFGGAEVAAVTSFHGELGNLTSQSLDTIDASVFVHHAELDFQGDEALRLFEEEMKTQDVGVWSTKYYGHMEHGWTDPSSDVYDHFQGELAHRDMFAAYRLLFGE